MKELSAYFVKIAARLDVCTVLEEAPKYEVRELTFEDPSTWGRSAWERGFYARLVWYDSYYKIHLNPDIDTTTAAGILSKRTDFEILPSEVYTFAFFHELGHTRTVAGRL